MYALLAFIPIVFCVVVMAVFNWPAKIAMPISWLITAVLGFFVWNIDVLKLTAYTVAGFFNSIEVLIIIFGAVLVMNTLKMSGGMVAINNGFRSISPDARVQAVNVGFLFVSFIEGAAGFGTPAALAAPLMISLGSVLEAGQRCGNCAGVRPGNGADFALLRFLRRSTSALLFWS